MCKKVLLGISKIADTTRVVFFKDGKIIAILEENAVTREILDLRVFSGDKQGRLLCHIVNEEANFVAYDNLSFLLHWLKQCKTHLRIPL
jgi:hypothetical protein